jgi:hypothetical protein
LTIPASLAKNKLFNCRPSAEIKLFEPFFKIDKKKKIKV